LSLVFGIIALVTCCFYGVTGIIFGILGIVMAVLSKKETQGQFVPIAIGGLVCSIIGLVAGIIYLVYLIVIIVYMGMTDSSFIVTSYITHIINI
jgi:hypothetical protein